MALPPIVDIPPLLATLRSEPLLALRLEVRPPLDLGQTPAGGRRVGVISGGVFSGERLRGEVLDGGSDWQTIRADGAWVIDCKIMLRTHDQALIGMHYNGLRHGPAEVLARLGRGEDVNPGEYYFRITPTFETADPRYDWLNRVVAVGQGHRFRTGPVYNMFAIL